MSITTSGTRTNGSPIITSIASTTPFVAGYYVFGTGIATGTTILSVDSGTQITLSANASSSGTSSFFVSPFLMNTGTLTLPNVTAAGRFRRSRQTGTKVGDVQTTANIDHNHTVSVTGSADSQGNHAHTITITDPGHLHNNAPTRNSSSTNTGSPSAIYPGSINDSTMNFNTSSNTTGITASSNTTGAHTHSVTASGTTSTSGSGSESRPYTLVVLTCIKT
jgi:hypothetical protein